MTFPAGKILTASELNDAVGIRLVNQRTTDASAATSTTLVDVLSVTLPRTGTFYFDVTILLTNTGAVGRPGFALGGTSTPSAWRWASQGVHYNTATGSQAGSASGTSYPGATGGTAITNSDWTTTTGFSSVRVVGQVTVTAAGTLTFRVNAATGSGNSVNVKASSIVKVEFISP